MATQKKDTTQKRTKDEADRTAVERAEKRAQVLSEIESLAAGMPLEDRREAIKVTGRELRSALKDVQSSDDVVLLMSDYRRVMSALTAGLTREELATRQAEIDQAQGEVTLGTALLDRADADRDAMAVALLSTVNPDTGKPYAQRAVASLLGCSQTAVSRALTASNLRAAAKASGVALSAADAATIANGSRQEIADAREALSAGEAPKVPGRVTRPWSVRAADAVALLERLVGQTIEADPADLEPMIVSLSASLDTLRYAQNNLARHAADQAKSA